MTLEQLKHIFRFQTTIEEEYEPNGKLSYWIFEPHQSPVNVIKNDTEWEAILEQVKEFEHDGYRDRIPTFVKTEL